MKLTGDTPSSSPAVDLALGEGSPRAFHERGNKVIISGRRRTKR
jgi:hypothetical protein